MQWHHAVPVLRILDVTADDSGMATQTRVGDVDIHGDVDHWYVPVDPAFPQQRQKELIGQSAAAAVITTAKSVIRARYLEDRSEQPKWNWPATPFRRQA